MKKTLIAISILILILAIVSIFITFDDKETDSNFSRLAIIVQNETGEGYHEWANETWPTDGYKFSEKSNCINNGTLSYDLEKGVTLNLNKSDKCTIFFDKEALPTITNITFTDLTYNSVKANVEVANFDSSKYKVQLGLGAVNKINAISGSGGSSSGGSSGGSSEVKTWYDSTYKDGIYTYLFSNLRSNSNYNISARIIDNSGKVIATLTKNVDTSPACDSQLCLNLDYAPQVIEETFAAMQYILDGAGMYIELEDSSIDQYGKVTIVADFYIDTGISPWEVAQIFSYNFEDLSAILEDYIGTFYAGFNVGIEQALPSSNIDMEMAQYFMNFFGINSLQQLYDANWEDMRYYQYPTIIARHESGIVIAQINVNWI